MNTKCANCGHEAGVHREGAGGGYFECKIIKPHKCNCIKFIKSEQKKHRHKYDQCNTHDVPNGAGSIAFFDYFCKCGKGKPYETYAQKMKRLSRNKS